MSHMSIFAQVKITILEKILDFFGIFKLFKTTSLHQNH